MIKAISLLLLFISIVKTTFAFDTEGHLKIETAGINLLKETLATDIYPDGITMYNYLLDNNILLNNSKINSAYPDLDLGRQFLSDRQIYHFMANSKYVISAIKESTLDKQKQALMINALPECLNMLYVLMQEVVENPKGAIQAGRGTYVLIHAITDSYSREHTIRNNITNEIESIKSWEMSKIFWPKNAKIIDPTYRDSSTLIFLHTIKGTADKEWADDKGDFSKNANKAIISIKELLITLYLASKDTLNKDKVITKYLSDNFKLYGSTLSENHFIINSDSIKISYLKEYKKYGVKNFDRYPQLSHMISYKSNFILNSFGYEFGYRITPTSASGSKTLLKRLPYGFLFSVHENFNNVDNSKFLETTQFQFAMNTALYLPYNNLSLEPKIGYSATPFFNQSFYSGIVLGADISFNIGPDFTFINNASRTMRIAIGYEYNSSKIQANHNFTLKFGFNTWQGRVIKRKKSS